MCQHEEGKVILLVNENSGLGIQQVEAKPEDNIVPDSVHDEALKRMETAKQLLKKESELDHWGLHEPSIVVDN